MHQWAGLTVTKYPDAVLDDHILANPKSVQSDRDRIFLPKVEPRGGNPLFGILKAAFCMAGWAAVLWATVSLLAFFILSHWNLPLMADLG